MSILGLSSGAAITFKRRPLTQLHAFLIKLGHSIDKVSQAVEFRLVNFSRKFCISRVIVLSSQCAQVVRSKPCLVLFS